MPFITLLTDLGYNDASVAKVESILMQQLPGMPLIGITHNVQPFYLPQAAYLLASAGVDMPQGTFHIVLYDLYYNDAPQLIYSLINGQHYLVPDNGILPLAFPQYDGNAWLCYEHGDNGNLASWVRTAAATVQQLSQGSPADAGLKPHTIQGVAMGSKPLVNGNEIECHVIHIDRFENVVLNLTKTEFEEAAKGRSFSIQLLRDDMITSISSHYNDVKPGEKLCRFNSAGYLEIAINKGNAAGLFGFRVRQEKQLLYNTIKISFE